LAGLPASERSRVWRVAAWKLPTLADMAEYRWAGFADWDWSVHRCVDGSGRLDQFIGIGAGAFLGGFIHGQVTIAYTRPYLLQSMKSEVEGVA
jgi:hypothetical protein